MTEDYPKTILEFERRFATDAACRAYLMALRWPECFVCPRCGGCKAWPTVHDRWVCAACRHQATVTAGTIFQDTRQPLRLWFRAMWYVTSQKNGASALGLQRVLGLGGYLTAWSWLHKLRRAMVRPGRERLGGEVEVDETYVGGLAEGPRGRGSQKKALSIATTAASHGTLAIQNAPRPDQAADVIYVPVGGFIGIDTFEYTIIDADGNTSTGMVTVEVTPQ